MDIKEFDRRARLLPLVELKRLNNTLAYLNDLKPTGKELDSVLMGLTLETKILLLDILKEGVIGNNPYGKDQPNKT